MTELTPEALRLLAQLRDLDDPTARERASGHAAVRGMLEAHGLAGLPPLAAVKLAGKRHAPLRTADVPMSHTLAAPSSAGAKVAWGFGAALVVALGFYTTQALRAPASAPQLAAHTQATPLDQPTPAAPLSTERVAAPPSREDSATASGGALHVRRSAPKPAASSLSDELKFVAGVDAELRSGGYDHALQRLAQHKSSPWLAEERAALRVLALCGRDNDAAAARARDHFLRSAPSSVLAARVRRACPGVPQP